MQIGEYIKLILEKKNITQQELVNRLNKINLNVMVENLLDFIFLIV